MAKDIVGILSVRDKLTRLLLEPTLDKVFSTFTSIMLGICLVSLFSTYTDSANITFLRTNPTLGVLVIINIVPLLCFLLATLSGTASILYQWKQEPILKQSDERRKSNKEWDYLLTHQHLKEMDIKLDKIEVVAEELEYYKKVLASIGRYIVEKESINNDDEPIEQAIKHVQEKTTDFGGFPPPIPNNLPHTVTEEVLTKAKTQEAKKADLEQLAELEL